MPAHSKFYRFSFLSKSFVSSILGSLLLVSSISAFALCSVPVTKYPSVASLPTPPKWTNPFTPPTTSPLSYLYCIG